MYMYMQVCIVCIMSLQAVHEDLLLCLQIGYRVFALELLSELLTQPLRSPEPGKLHVHTYMYMYMYMHVHVTVHVCAICWKLLGKGMYKKTYSEMCISPHLRSYSLQGMSKFGAKCL